MSAQHSARFAIGEVRPQLATTRAPSGPRACPHPITGLLAPPSERWSERKPRKSSLDSPKGNRSLPRSGAPLAPATRRTHAPRLPTLCPSRGALFALLCALSSPLGGARVTREDYLTETNHDFPVISCFVKSSLAVAEVPVSLIECL